MQGFTLGHQTDQGLYQTLSKYPERGRRFVNAMSGFAKRTGNDELEKGFDWESVSTMVDVGGGRGEVGVGLAERFGHLNCTIQDLKHVVNEQLRLESENLRRRVEFVDHDFFTPQITKGADVYYFRYIFHNLPDESCVQLLQAQISGMTPCLELCLRLSLIMSCRSEKWITHLDSRRCHS